MTNNPQFADFIPTQPAPPAMNSDDIQIRWVMPENFHDLPVTELSDDEAIRRIEDLAEKVLPGVDEESKTWFSVICALGVDGMRAMRAEYASLGLLSIDNKPCSATIFVSLIDSIEIQDGLSTSATTAFALRKAAAGEVSEIELPCGSAVSCIGSQEVRVTGDLHPSGTPTMLPTHFIRIYLPLPNETTMVMQLDTSDLEGWDVFSTVFGNVISSIRLFHADGSPVPPAKSYA